MFKETYGDFSSEGVISWKPTGVEMNNLEERKMWNWPRVFPLTKNMVLSLVP